MTKKVYIRLAIAGFMLCSCQSDSYRIKGCAQRLMDGDTITLAFEDSPQKILGRAFVSNGVFKFSGTTDTTLFCRAYLNRDKQTNVSFFLEPGNITIELNQHPRPSRVSGTILNNEWQTLNDSVQKLGNKLILLAEASPKAMHANNKQIQASIDSLHRRISQCIIQAAQRNKSNVLGRYIIENYKEPEFK